MKTNAKDWTKLVKEQIISDEDPGEKYLKDMKWYLLQSPEALAIDRGLKTLLSSWIMS